MEQSEKDKLEQHLYTLNERMRVVEEETLDKVEKITRHLIECIGNGMDEYRTFNIDGYVVIEPCSDDVPDEILNKFLDLDRHHVVIAGEVFDQEKFNEHREHLRHYDYRYFANPEEYPEGYIPMTRAYDQLVISAMAQDKITEEDLLFVKPEDIQSYIVISI